MFLVGFYEAFGIHKGTFSSIIFEIVKGPLYTVLDLGKK